MRNQFRNNHLLRSNSYLARQFVDDLMRAVMGTSSYRWEAGS